MEINIYTFLISNNNKFNNLTSELNYHQDRQSITRN